MSYLYELILGAELSNDAPKNVIETIKYMCDISEEVPENYLWGGRKRNPINNMVESELTHHPIFVHNRFSDNYILITRASIKGLDEINDFIEMIKPYVISGSGANEMFAVVTGESWVSPILHYANKD